MNPVLTDWLTIATAGPTVDGRTIKEEWLTDAAATYNREEYTAFLNVEHWSGNLGSVWDVRLSKDKKKRTVLQARIRPNKYYLQQNAEDHRLCFSVELTHNFAETGKTYLTGLATTDSPASIGTTEARFSRADVFRSAPETFEEIPLVQPAAPGLAETLKDILKEFFTSTNKKESEMTKEEFTEALKPLTDGIAALAEKFDSMQPAKPENPPAAPQTESEFKTELGKVTEALTVLSGKLDDALKNVPPRGDQPGTGVRNDEPLI